MKIIALILLVLISTVSSLDLLKSLLSLGSSGEKEVVPVSDEKAQQYLLNYGYVPPSGILSSDSGLDASFQDAKHALKNAIMEFQKFANIKETGELDTKTKQKMAEPRCGVVDVQAIMTTRESAFKWRKNHVTYSIENTSPDLPLSDVQSAIRRAFDTWSKVIPVDFTEVTSTDRADIKVAFGSNYHNDPWPFDGQGGVLAHATNPPDGKLHFDLDEKWAYMDPRKISLGSTDIFAVALHESGHTLGLTHSRDENSIMAPFYKKTVNSEGDYVMPKLAKSDIVDIQDLYGARRTPSNLPLEPTSRFQHPSSNRKTTPSPPIRSDGECRETQNKNIIDNNLSAVGGQLSQCCGLCKSTSGCQGYVWNDFHGGTCWLKSSTGYTEDKVGVIMGTL